MSSAFVKESDDQWLHEISPTLNALVVYLTRENNGVRVYEKSSYESNASIVHVMSNGLSYKIDEKNAWAIVC